MLITKFNKMIRNRIVWWIIGGIVIITFVGWFSPHGGCETTAPTGQAGSLDGQPVTAAELRTARFDTYLDFCMMSGRKPSMTPQLDKILDEMAWKRVAALRMAKSIGLNPPTDAELLAEIQRQQIFQANGAFSKNQYLAFERNFLTPLGATTAQFENKLREDMILYKLQSSVASAAWVSPPELQRMVARYADNFRVDYVTLGTNMVSGSDISLTDDDIKAFYTDHTNLFEIPPRVGVRYVSLPISNYLSKADVETITIEEYYDTHTDEFTTTDTNGTKVLAPIEDVRSSISNLLVRESSTQAARDAGTDLVISLAPARDGAPSVFEKVAEAAGLAVKTTALFNAEGPVPDINGDFDFINAAFKLRPTPDEYFSDAVLGNDSVYILALATNAEPYVPAFEDVSAKVKPLAHEEAVKAALTRAAESVRRKFQEGLSKNESFAVLAKQQTLNVSTTEYFSAYSPPEAMNSPEILESIVVLNRGELSDLISVTNGYVIACIADRKPASEEEASAVRSQLGANIVRRRARILFSEWQAAMVKAGRTGFTEAPETTAEEE
jgi:peptidyl-prolyl cis-trans isomerase D